MIRDTATRPPVIVYQPRCAREIVSSQPSEVVYVRAPRGSSTALWLVVVLLAVIATALICRQDDRRLLSSAQAQTGFTGAAGVFAFTGQLTGRTFGLFMVDVDSGTVWCYELEKGPTGEFQLRLVAARSWIFDRYLEEFNCAEPTPAAVKAMISHQESHREAAPAKTSGPSGTPSP